MTPMKYKNATPVTSWRIDESGLMRVTACILQDDVIEYGKDDFDEWPEEFEGKDTVREFIAVSSIDEETLATLEGKQVTISTSEEDAHAWRHPSNASTDGLAVGSVAGTPKVEEGKLICDFVITDEDAIDRIKSGDLVEVSAGYTGELALKSGTYNDQPFDAIQSGMKFNHILLLPKGGGRCGSDVKILNTNRRGTKVEKNHVVKMQFRNSMKTYRFVNADDREEAERMANEAAEEATEIKAEDVENALARCNELKTEMEAKNAELEESRKVIEDFKQKLANALDPEEQEALASELLEQAADEEAIMDSEVEEEDKVELENKRKNCKSRVARRSLIVKHIMNKKGVNTDAWTPDAIDGAFASLTVLAKNHKGKTSARLPNGGVKVTNASPAKDNFSRMMNGYRKEGK